MTDFDHENMEKYTQYQSGKMHYDEGSFFIEESKRTRTNSNQIPNHVMVVIFSADKIKQNIEVINVSSDSGAFFYRKEDNLLLEASLGNAVGASICWQLEMNNRQRDVSTERVKVDGEWYLVFIGGSGTLGTFVQYVKEAPVIASMNQFRNNMYLLIGVMIIMSLLFVLYTQRIIHKPIKVLLQAFEEVKIGNWTKHIHYIGKDEFSYLYDGFNDMEDQIIRLIDNLYVQTNLAQTQN